MKISRIAIGCGLLAVIYGIITSGQVLRQAAGNQKMQDIAAAILEGAQAYLGRQYTTIASVGVVVAVIVFLFLGTIAAVGFVVGALLSGVAGYIGMNILVRANVRTAEAARVSLQGGLTTAFRSGAITGMLVAGLALLAIASFFYVLVGLQGPLIVMSQNRQSLKDRARADTDFKVNLKNEVNIETLLRELAEFRAEHKMREQREQERRAAERERERAG